MTVGERHSSNSNAKREDEMAPDMSVEIERAFAAFEAGPRGALEEARLMIFEVAAALDEVSGIEESLKWGQPSYAPKPKTGTPIRLSVTKAGALTLFVNCQTTLVADLAANNPHDLATIDNRAVLLPETVTDHPGLRSFVKVALTYHLN
jgi:hypothetical protein